MSRLPAPSIVAYPTDRPERSKGPSRASPSAQPAASDASRPGAGGIGTSDGTATTRQPAAVAEATPFGESSSATHRAGSASSSLTASRYGSGSGLVTATSSAHTV